MSGEVTESHKVVFMFEFAKNINEINAGQEYYSAACVMRHLAWKILIQRNRSEDDGEFEFVDSHDTLTVKLHCGGKSQLWCSHARIRLTIVSQEKGTDSFSREFENLFHSNSPVWGYSNFIEWEKVVNPENGFVKDNVLKFQAHVVANIPQDPDVENRDMPVERDDWLALFEGNLNDKIVQRISCEFTKMNSVVENALKDEKICKEIIGAAINPINAVIRTEIQALEKKLEKFCTIQINKVARIIKNINVNDNDPSGGDGTAPRGDLNEEESTKKINTAEEEMVPVSVLKIMKELIVEQQQQRTSFGWMPSLYGARAAYYRTNELSYQPDSVRESEEIRIHKGVLPPLAFDNGSDHPMNSSQVQLEDVAAEKSSKKQGNTSSTSCANVAQQLRKNGKRKNEEVYESNGDDLANSSNKKMSKPSGVQEEMASLAGQSEKELLFLGKNMNGEVKVHKVAEPQQLLDLTKKYPNFKILGADEF